MGLKYSCPNELSIYMMTHLKEHYKIEYETNIYRSSSLKLFGAPEVLKLARVLVSKQSSLASIVDSWLLHFAVQVDVASCQNCLQMSLVHENLDVLHGIPGRWFAAVSSVVWRNFANPVINCTSLSGNIVMKLGQIREQGYKIVSMSTSLLPD